MREKNYPVFYGWVNLFVLWICYLATVGAITYNFGVTLSVMCDELGMSMVLATACNSGCTFAQSVLASTRGRYIEKYGVRRSFMLGTGAMAIGCVLMGAAQNIWMYVLAWIPMISIAQQFAGTSAALINVTNWFYQKNALATSVFLTLGGISGFIFTPLMTRIMQSTSWRITWFVIAGLSVLAFTLLMFLLKNRPEEIGEIPDGRNNIPFEKNTSQGSAGYKTQEVWSLRDAERSVQFYQICFIQVALAFLAISVSSQALNYMVTKNISMTAAAAVIGLYSVISTFSRLAVGVLSRRVSMKRMMLFATACALGGVLILLNLKGMIGAYLFAIGAGIGFGVFMVAPPTMLADFYGMTDYVKINSRYSMITGLAASVTAVTVGAIYDYTGGYRSVWMFIMFIILLNGVSMILLKPPILKEKIE